MIKPIFSKATSIGRQAEDAARDFLIEKGLTHVQSNFACKLGEIDLIMRDGDTFVFVEVRFRKNTAFGGAAASVDSKKQNKIRQTAMHYLQQSKLYEKYPVRFDVIAQSTNDTQWITGAF